MLAETSFISYLPTMLVYVLVVISGLSALAEDCPHLQKGLQRWSDPNTWSDKKVPVNGDDVIVTGNVLLDRTTARLDSITIESSGQLVWSPEGDFTLSTSYVAVHGKFIIGSETCKYNRTANIKLLGDFGTAPNIPGTDEAKQIAVFQGGTLEIHGKRKLSWTKLVKTVPKALDEGLISGHKDKCRKGLYVFEFDATTGKMLNTTRYATSGQSDSSVADRIQSHLNEIPSGTMVMIATCKVAFGSLIDRNQVHEAIELLLFLKVTGTSLIRQVTPHSFDSYVAFAIKGSPSESQEDFTAVTSTVDGQHSIITRTFWDLGFKVTVESFVDSKGKNGYIDARARTLETAYPIIDLLDDASTWHPGDRIFLASTDFNYDQAEEATVITCTTCSPTQIRIDLEPRYTHWGEMEEGVDERGEVGLLTRYIRIEGEMQDTCPPANGNCEDFPYDTYGGCIKAFEGFKDVHIEGAEFYHVGKQVHMGSYPIHFHMCLDVDDPDVYPNPPYVKDNSIHHSFSRCVTVHGTSGVTITDNVGFDVLGHCYFLEDGGERRNVLDGNLGASVKKGSLTPTDDKGMVSVFWITNPMNIVKNNVAAGSMGNGIWYVFPVEPIGPSKGLGMMRPYEARETQIWEFTNNVAHSSHNTGIEFDNELKENGKISLSNKYDPKETPLVKNSPHAEAHFHRITAYKNRRRNAWARGGWVTVSQSSLADSLEGFAFECGHGTMSQFLNTSIILGESRNIGEPTKSGGVQYDRALPRERHPDEPVFGFRQHYGPVIVTDCWFNHFETTDVRPSGAYGFMDSLSTPTTPIQPVFNLQFGFDDGPTTGNRLYEGIMGESKHFGDLEGDYTPTIRDLDGSLTGRANSTVVRTTPFHITKKCYTRDNWQLSACPYIYGKVFLSTDTSEKNTSEWEDLVPFMRADDIPDVKERHDAKAEKKAFSIILGHNYSYTLNWEKKIHTSFTVQVLGVERDSPVRVGLCLPRDATFDLQREGFVSLDDISAWEPANSLAEVEGDDTGKKYFWDSDVGLLFIKFQHSEPRNVYYETCPNFKCDTVHVTILSGDLTDADCTLRAYGPYSNPDVVDSIPAMEEVNMGMTSTSPPEGYGAGETRPFAGRAPVDGGFGDWGDWETCSVTCGGGIEVRRRMCDNPIPENGGKNCDTSFKARYRTRECNTQPCTK